ncbi:MAG: hypothetical protein J6K89_06990 [Oscillospiraceae bacterium]|nr:hypothetical protein [Oscillospiraceae bacterium]
MTVETLEILSIVGYILAGLFFILSVVLFFTMKVPKLISDLTGRTEKKAIAAIRQQSEQREDNVLTGNTDRIGKPDNTGRIGRSGLLSRQDKQKGKATAKKGIRYGNVVTKPGSAKDSEVPTAPLPVMQEIVEENLTTTLRQDEPSDETSVLSAAAEDDETTLLSAPADSDETTILSQPAPSDETTILSQPAVGETTVLSQGMTGDLTQITQQNRNKQSAKQTAAPAVLVVEVDRFFMESKELIE